VLGDRGLGDVEAAGDFPNGRRADGEAFDDPAADRMGESLERIINYLVNYSEARPRRFGFKMFGAVLFGAGFLLDPLRRR
jgi:hypothetical protein